MHDVISDYQGLVLSLGVLAALMLVQLLVVDMTGIRAKHVPGMPVEGGHDNFLFRAVRAHGNSNESLPTFLLITIFALAIGAHPGALNTLVMVFVCARAGHMLCYYLDWRIARSISFGVGLIAMAGLLVAGVLAI